MTSNETATKPYLYFEQIMNGIVSIPESVQAKLTNVMLVRREQLMKPETPSSESISDSSSSSESESQSDSSSESTISSIGKWFNNFTQSSPQPVTQPNPVSNPVTQPEQVQYIEEHKKERGCNIRKW